MALASRLPSIWRRLSEERRRFQRVRVNLLGRYMLADRREFPCQVVNMSPGGMALIAPVAGQTGERVIAYVDHLGRLEGQIARMFQNGFAMTVSATPRKRDKLAAQLTWLANRHILGLAGRSPPRPHTPTQTAGRLIMPNGVNLACRIIDMSLSGAAIATDQRPAIGVAGHARQGPGARRAPSRRRLRHRVHPHAASGLSRRERHRCWVGCTDNAPSAGNCGGRARCRSLPDNNPRHSSRRRTLDLTVRYAGLENFMGPTGTLRRGADVKRHFCGAKLRRHVSISKSVTGG